VEYNELMVAYKKHQFLSRLELGISISVSLIKIILSIMVDIFLIFLCILKYIDLNNDPDISYRGQNCRKSSL